MPKYRVWGTVTGSKYLGDFEASKEEEAIEIAICKTHVSLCHQCSSECEDPEVTSAEAMEIKEPSKEHGGSHE